MWCTTAQNFATLNISPRKIGINTSTEGIKSLDIQQEWISREIIFWCRYNHKIFMIVIFCNLPRKTCQPSNQHGPMTQWQKSCWFCEVSERSGMFRSVLYQWHLDFSATSCRSCCKKSNQIRNKEILLPMVSCLYYCLMGKVSKWTQQIYYIEY